MQVSIRKILNKEKEQVIIECAEVTPQVREIYSYVQNKGIEISGMAEEQYQKNFVWRMFVILRLWMKKYLPVQRMKYMK